MPARPSPRSCSPSSSSIRRRQRFSSPTNSVGRLTFIVLGEVEMNRQQSRRTAMLAAATVALLSLTGCGDDSSSTALLQREAIVPVDVVTQYFPDATRESSTGPNETSVGKALASRSVVFTSADGKKKVTLSIDQYASVSDAAAAYQTAVQGSKAAPGFKPAASPDLGQEAFAGTSQVGAEMHFRARHARWAADRVGDARGRHPGHARQFEQPHQPRWRGTRHRQEGPWF